MTWNLPGENGMASWMVFVVADTGQPILVNMSTLKAINHLDTTVYACRNGDEIPADAVVELVISESKHVVVLVDFQTLAFQLNAGVM